MLPARSKNHKIKRISSFINGVAQNPGTPNIDRILTCIAKIKALLIQNSCRLRILYNK
jgi:hypothetical protein